MEHDNLKIIKVSQNNEWADVYLLPLRRGKSNGVQLTIHSSYGSCGHIWGNIGPQSAGRFLTGVTEDYLVGKLFDSRISHVFSMPLLIRELRRMLAEEKKSAGEESTVDWAEAEQELDAFAQESYASADYAFALFERDCPTLSEILGDSFEVSELASSCRVLSHDVKGFLDNIWQPLCEQLKADPSLAG